MNGHEKDDRAESRQPWFGRYCAAPHLRPFVRNYWTLQVTGGAGVRRWQRIVPDGCIDILFVRQGPTEDFHASVVGMMTRPVLTELTARAEYLGIRFAPGGFAQLFGTPAGDLTDRIVPLEHLLPASPLTERVARASDIRTRLQVVEESLGRWDPGELAPALPAVLRAISASQGGVSVAQLARVAGWSPRHLGRVFRQAVGVGPKTFCTITRFKRALRALRRRPRPDLLQVALEAGYYDQAHFIHEFNRFYGASPSAVFADPAF